MINIFSIEEIVKASNSILKSSKKESVTINDDMVKENKMPKQEPLILTDKTEDLSKKITLNKDLEEIIIQAEKSLIDKDINDNKKKETKKNTDVIAQQLYILFKKKIKKNALKLIIELKNDIDVLNKKIIFVNETETKIKEDNRFFKEKIKILKNSETNLKYNLNNKSLEINSNNTLMKKNKNKIDKLKDDKEILNSKIKTYQNQYNQLEIINQDLKNTNQELNINNETYKKKIEKLENVINDLNSKIKTYQNQYNQLEIINQDLKNTNQELNINNETYKKKIEKLENVIKDLDFKLDKDRNKNILLEEQDIELQNSLREINELKHFRNESRRLEQANSNLENMLEKLKITDDKNLQNLDIIKTLQQKINFYQEENIRVSNELIDSRKKFDLTRNETQKLENQRLELLEKVNSVNDVLRNSNIVTNVFENQKSNDDEKDSNLNKKFGNDLNKEILNIFKK